MSYCTQAQLIERYSERMLIDISDRGEVATGEIDAALIARAIADADALIDGYLKPRYALPLQAAPRLLTDISLRVAIYYAHAHVAEHKIKDDYNAALKTLSEISRGIIQLDVDGVEPAASGASEIRMTETDRRLTSSSMKGYI